MIKKGAIILGAIGLTLSSCIKHEVIPAPEPTVDLKCEFSGVVGGAYTEYTENVNGYSCSPGLSKQTTAGQTSAQYLFSMQSQSETPYVQIGLGSLVWADPTGTSRPALTSFNQFFAPESAAMNSNTFSNGALAGFEVTYRDAYADIWTSDETNSTVKDVEFVTESISQESDASGDYTKFTCNFEAEVFHTYSVVDITVIPQTNPPTMRDSVASLVITDAIYKGFFKR